MNKEKTIVISNTKAIKRMNAIASEARKILAEQEEHGFQSFKLAAEFGKLMNEAKEFVPYGEFGQWLEQEFPALSPRTCNNYMRLADWQRVAKVNDDISLRKAYVKAGIIQPVPKQLDAPARKALPAPASTETVAERVPDQQPPAPSAPKSIVASAPPVTAAKTQETVADVAVTLDKNVGVNGDATESVPVTEPPLTEAEVTELLKTELTMPELRAGAVEAWCNKPDGQKWLKHQHEAAIEGYKATVTERLTPEQKRATERAARDAADIEAGRCVRIKTGPPMTLALFKIGVDTLMAMIPKDANHVEYSEYLSDKSAAELKLANSAGRRDIGYSAYTK